MRIITVFASISIFSLISLIGCTIYQSDGREAIEDNKADIVVIMGVDDELNTEFQCLRSVSAPEETKGPAQVIDHEDEADGYSAFLVTNENNKNLIVYLVPNLELGEPHLYCDLDTHGDYSKSKIRSAIRLGVRLLAEQKELD